MKAIEAFESRDRSVTMAYQNSLIQRGVCGQLAFGLFRAQKRSTFAKGYRRGGHRKNSYDKKNDALKYVDAILSRNQDALTGIHWGWKEDPRQEYHNWVLYVEFENRTQCSFHAASPISGKRFAGEWDREHRSQNVILSYCDIVYRSEPERPLTDHDAMPFGSHVGVPLHELSQRSRDWLLSWDGIDAWPPLKEYLSGAVA